MVFLKKISSEEKGASMVEYALLVALIAAVAIVAIRGLGTAVQSKFNSVANDVNQAN
jgi:pilus assembly protein Flp/PilA